MKRSALQRRAPLRRGTVRVGAAAARRRNAGGRQAAGRPSLSVPAYHVERGLAFLRSGGICEVTGERGILEPDHIIPRGQGGSDSHRNLVMILNTLHARRQWAYTRGRLVYALVFLRDEPEPVGVYPRIEYRDRKGAPLRKVHALPYVDLRWPRPSR